jgi:hypothetical protein
MPQHSTKRNSMHCRHVPTQITHLRLVPHRRHNNNNNNNKPKELTPWSRVLPKDLGVAHLVKKLPISTELKDLFLCSHEPVAGPYPKSDEPSPNPTNYFFNVHFNHLPNGLFLQVFRLNMNFSSLPWMLHSHPSHPPWYGHINNICLGVQIMKIITMKFPTSCHFLPLRSKYSPRHPVLKHLQSIFFPQGERQELK